ncbi:hypothetical protein FWH13_01200 [Candidatus Saccharibacteria bacterium]|nr:hypothetical protein [Candidatus Saccharibacteria bacterium]
MKTLTKILGCLTAVTLVAASAGVAYANNESGRRLLMSPIESRFTLDPGMQTAGEFTIKNNGNQTLTFDVRAEAVDVNVPDYSDIFGDAAKSSQTLLANWITFDNGTEWTLQPDEYVQVKYNINVPTNAPGGAQRAVILATMRDEGATIDVHRQAAHRVFATVTGDLRSSASVTRIRIPSLLFRAPIRSHVKLENTGNTDEWASGTMTIENFFGGRERARIETSHVVLSERPRDVEIRWEGAPGIGIFRVTQEITLLGKTTSESSVVFIIPLYLIVIVGLLLALLIGKIILDRKR